MCNNDCSEAKLKWYEIKRKINRFLYFRYLNKKQKLKFNDKGARFGRCKASSKEPTKITDFVKKEVRGNE